MPKAAFLGDYFAERRTDLMTELKKTTITTPMAICSNCFSEFDLGDTAYVDEEKDYLCVSCKEERHPDVE